MKKNKLIQVSLAVLFTELAGFLGMKLAGPTSSLYQTLIKPPLYPPSQLFGIVWPILYFLMGISLYLIYNSQKSQRQQKSIDLFLLQLFVNILWPVVFFRFQMYWLAVLVILLLDVLVAMTIKLFYTVNKKAAYLLLPYMLWILFATYLNIGIALLN